MYSLIMNACYVFFIVLEVILFLYIISTWLKVSPKIMIIFSLILGPILEPIQYLTKRSIFQVANYDISPLIALIPLTYLQEFFRSLI